MLKKAGYILSLLLFLGSCATQGTTGAGTAPKDGEPNAPVETHKQDIKPNAAQDDRNKITGSGSDLMLVKPEENKPAPTIATGEVNSTTATTTTPAGPVTTAPPRPAAPAESGLRAGFSDDNREYNYFLSFLEKFKNDVRHKDLPVNERIFLRFTDSDGKPASLTKLTIQGAGQSESGLASGDGTYLLFPSEFSAQVKEFKITATFQGQTVTKTIPRTGNREIITPFTVKKSIIQPLPVDLVFILDTTGSMGEEIARLKATLEIIHMNLSALPSKPLVRFGMVLYKDKGDDEAYRTKSIPLTADIAAFQAQLDQVTADGGGDNPEDLVKAMDEAVMGLSWNDKGAKLAFVITDAPPKDYQDAPRSYADLSKKAKEKAIRVFTVGTGSLPLEGEYVLRQIAQYTYAKYIFLTYGEKGESEGGKEGSVSHHTGSNFTTDKLETIIIRFAREEITAFTGVKDPEPEDFFQANRMASEDREKTLDNLFTQAVGQLVSYSTWKITTDTPMAVLPLGTSIKKLEPQAEYFTNQFLLSAARNRSIKLVERKDLDKLLQEQELKLTGLTDEAKAPAIGKILGAHAVVSGVLYEKPEYYEVFLKLLRVETGEILSLTKARLDKKLGL